jgi:ribosomal protein S25
VAVAIAETVLRNARESGIVRLNSAFRRGNYA